jgi:hypothetical protein
MRCTVSHTYLAWSLPFAGCFVRSGCRYLSQSAAMATTACRFIIRLYYHCVTITGDCLILVGFQTSLQVCDISYAYLAFGGARISRPVLWLGCGIDTTGIELRCLSGAGVCPERHWNSLTQSLVQWVPGAPSLGVKRPGSESHHSSPSSVEVKNGWIYTSAPPICFHVLHRDKLTFIFLLSFMCTSSSGLRTIHINPLKTKRIYFI